MVKKKNLVKGGHCPMPPPKYATGGNCLTYIQYHLAEFVEFRNKFNSYSHPMKELKIQYVSPFFGFMANVPCKVASERHALFSI